MDSLWDFPDFDEHELVHFVTDRPTGLKAVIAVHSTHLGPGAGGTRFWHYAEPGDAVADALRLSRGMSYKNAMAGLPLGGGKAVILADEARDQDARSCSPPSAGRSTRLGGRYVTAEDVGINVADMVAIAKQTRFVAGLPVADGRGRRRSRAAHQLRRLPRRQGGGEAQARQGQPRRPPHRHPGRGQRRRRPRPPRRGRGRPAQHRRHRPGPRPGARRARPAATVVATDAIMTLEADVLSPNALGAILTEAVDRRAQRADRRRRRQQPARHARRRRPHPRARHPLRARLRDQRRRHHQRLDRISEGRRRGDGPRADRGDPRPLERSGRKATPPAATPPASPATWRGG